MASKFVLIDLDRTLINESYELMDESVIDSIRAKKEQGWQVGLSSDTPLPTLLRWWDRFGMNGPIIYEKGAAIWFPEDDADIKLTLAGGIIAKARSALISRIGKMKRTMLICGDTVNFVRVIKAIPGSEDHTLIAVGGLREFSIAFHILRIVPGTGRLVIDLELSRTVLNYLEDSLPISEYLADGVFDPDYSFFYINPNDVDKGLAAERVHQDCRSTRTVVIGDSMSDFPEGYPHLEVYAVGNASADFKAKAHRVAKGTYSTGVKEILEEL